VLADPVTAEHLAGAVGGAGAADVLQQTATGETGERADPCTSTLSSTVWGTAATGRSDPVCTVVTAELGQRVGWRWPLVGRESEVECHGRRPAQTAAAGATCLRGVPSSGRSGRSGRGERGGTGPRGTSGTSGASGHVGRVRARRRRGASAIARAVICTGVVRGGAGWCGVVREVGRRQDGAAIGTFCRVQEKVRGQVQRKVRGQVQRKVRGQVQRKVRRYTGRLVVTSLFVNSPQGDGAGAGTLVQFTSSCKKVRKGAFADTRQKVITNLPSLSPVSYRKQWRASLTCGRLRLIVMATSPQTSLCGLSCNWT
jgi:hypothetical protein